MFDLLITLLYQPFLNVLVIFYWLVGFTPVGYDMGVAVILLTILIRILMLPLTLSAHRSQSERREIEQRIHALEQRYVHDPVLVRQEAKKIWRGNTRMLISEGFAFGIQLAIALILWRIFARGLGGQDLHLLYSWMPQVPQPYNLTFLGRFDLTHPDMLLNFIQAVLIFLVEVVAVLTAPYLYSRNEMVRVQIILPLVSFIIFAFLPAGKKLFVITALSFSLLVMIGRVVWEWWQRTFPPPPPEEHPPEEKHEVAEEKPDSGHEEPASDPFNIF